MLALRPGYRQEGDRRPMNDLELGAMRQKLEDTAMAVEEIRSDQKLILERLDKRYVTRLETRSINVILGIAVTVLALWDKVR